jgi:hypothetical protein
MMQTLRSIIVATALILCGQPVHAGIVLSETEVHSGLGGSARLSKTVYVQGRKQKIETPSNQTIIDLDEGVIYVIDPKRRSYAEISFPPKRDHKSAGAPKFDVALGRTGRSRRIDGYACDEYEGTSKLDVMDVTINQCISTDAPGVHELAAFQRELLSNLTGQGPKGSADAAKEGVPLEQRSTIRPRLPVASSGDNATSAPIMMTQTRVKNIQVRSLPLATFEPPEGFRREAPLNEGGLEV